MFAKSEKKTLRQSLTMFGISHYWQQVHLWCLDLGLLPFSQRITSLLYMIFNLHSILSLCVLTVCRVGG